MPITSHQVSSMVGGQQAMFGNFASYAQQISPGFQGQPPTYANPMAGAGSGFTPPPMRDPSIMGAGVEATSAVGNIGLPVAGTAALLGASMMGGRAGNFFGNLDPFSMGLKGFAHGAGLRAGGMGIMNNMGRIAAGGVGSVARAGLGGLAGAVAGAAPMMAAGQAMQYGVGQAVQGAQFQNQVQGVLDQNFRFLNPSSQTGFGFNRDQGSQIASMVREMGHQDMMTGPQELLRVMKTGTQQGLFRAVQDVKEFKKRFTETVGSLKEIAKTMNTTLEGAMPFFTQSRQMGFWTPGDISRNAQQVQRTAATSGISVAQTQQMMAQGAQMARSVGARGATGAMGMQQSLELVGGGLRSGFLSEQELSEATGGLVGPEAAQSLAGTLQAGMTRFSRSRRARWALASMGRNGFTSLDPGKMQDMISGTTSLRDVSRGARKNISEQGAFNFVNNERDLRGELLKQGPAAQLGFIRSMIGSRIYGDDPKNKFITRRFMSRNFGISGRQADAVARLARRAPQIQALNESRGAAVTDQLERTQDDAMNRSWEGVKRKASRFWDTEVKERLQQFGADFSKNISDYLEKSGDKLWGRSSARYRFRGIGGVGMSALEAGARGNTDNMEMVFGKSGAFGASMSGDLGLAGSGSSFMRGFEGGGGLGNAIRNLVGGGSVGTDKMELFRSMGAKEYGSATEAERAKKVGSGQYLAGRYASGATEVGTGRSMPYLAFEREEIERLGAGLSAAVSGRVSSQKQASALGFGSPEDAKKEIEAARAAMEGNTTFQRAAIRMAAENPDLTPRELARKQVEAIKAGGMNANIALQEYVKGGGDEAGMIHRLALAHPQRGKAGGIDLSKEAKTAGLDTFSGLENISKQVEAGYAAGEAELAKAVKGKLTISRQDDSLLSHWKAYKYEKSDRYMSASTPQLLSNISEKGKGRFKTAMLLMNSGDEDAVERGRKLLRDMAGDEDTFTADERKVLSAMEDPNHPRAKEIMAGVKKMAGTIQLEMRGRFADTVLRRGQRLFRNLGDQRDQFLGSLDEIKAKGDEKGTSLGELVRGLRNETDPQVYLKKMQQIVEVSSEADPEAVAAAAEKLRGIGGGEQIVAAMTGGRQIGDLTRGLTSKTPRVAADAANAALGSLMGDSGISPKQMQKFLNDKTSEKTLEKILEGVPKENRERVEDVLRSAKSGNVGNITQSLKEQATSDALLRLSPDNILARSSQDLRKDISVLGELGSGKGMHSEMLRQSGYLQEISIAVSKSAGIVLSTGNPQEKAFNNYYFA